MLFANKIYSQNFNKEHASPGYAAFAKDAGLMKNSGQFTDQKNNVVKSILYGTHIGNCGIYITNKGLSFINYKVKKTTSVQGARSTKAGSTNAYPSDIERVDIVLQGAVIKPESVVEFLNPENNAIYNYYTSSDISGVVNMRTLKEVIFKNVYQGIDWSIQFSVDLRGNEVIKYNFIVRPGGDVSKIKLHYSDNVRLRLNDNGDLIAGTTLTNFVEQAPVSFFQQIGDPLIFKYEIKDQLVKFSGEKKHFDKTVVIDPAVFWGTFLPSSQPGIVNQYIQGADVASDKDANTARETFMVNLFFR